MKATQTTVPSSSALALLPLDREEENIAAALGIAHDLGIVGPASLPIAGRDDALGFSEIRLGLAPADAHRVEGGAAEYGVSIHWAGSYAPYLSPHSAATILA